MSENVPQTREEIVTAIENGYTKYHIAEAVARWREAWLRDAEPRLRPVTETPNSGDTVLIRGTLYPHEFSAVWENGASFPAYATGWYLIKRADVPRTYEQALRLLVADIRSLGSPPEQLLVALAKAEEALEGAKP